MLLFRKIIVPLHLSYNKVKRYGYTDFEIRIAT